MRDNEGSKKSTPIVFRARAKDNRDETRGERGTLSPKESCSNADETMTMRDNVELKESGPSASRAKARGNGEKRRTTGGNAGPKKLAQTRPGPRPGTTEITRRTMRDETEMKSGPTAALGLILEQGYGP